MTLTPLTFELVWMSLKKPDSAIWRRSGTTTGARVDRNERTVHLMWPPRTWEKWRPELVDTSGFHYREYSYHIFHTTTLNLYRWAPQHGYKIGLREFIFLHPSKRHNNAIPFRYCCESPWRDKNEHFVDVILTSGPSSRRLNDFHWV